MIEASDLSRCRVLLVDDVRSSLDVLVEALQGHHLLSLALDGERLLLPDEPALERLLTRLGVPWTRGHAPFLPLSTGSPH